MKQVYKILITTVIEKKVLKNMLPLKNLTGKESDIIMRNQENLNLSTVLL